MNGERDTYGGYSIYPNAGAATYQSYRRRTLYRSAAFPRSLINSSSDTDLGEPLHWL